MKLLFCHDTYYTKSPSNEVYSYGAFPYELWQTRFLKHYTDITVIGRKKEFDPLIDDCLIHSSGKNVSFKLLDNINTPFKRTFKAKAQTQYIETHIKNTDAIVIRGPVEYGMIAAKLARKHNKPYAVEMSGCAFDHTWHHGSIIGKIYAPIKYIRAKHMVKNAAAVTYVTKNFLQQRYPNTKLTAYASNVEINETPHETLDKKLKSIKSENNKNTYTLGLIGNVNNHLKGLNVAIKAISKLKKQGISINLKILGQGNPKKWENLLKKHNLSDEVEFCGLLSGTELVLKWLDTIDIYIQPSYHEGLPRGLIEAMSRGCPALASNAGGTDELLPPQLIHKKGDYKSLAKHIKSILPKETRLKLAKQNFEKSQEYTSHKLNIRRDQFWQSFYNLVENAKTFR